MALAAVVGHLTWAFLVRRPLLSILWQSYRFMRALGRRVGRLWPEVRAELATAKDLLVLAKSSLRRGWAIGAGGRPLVLASDASEEGGGVVHTEASEAELELLIDHVGVKGGNVAPLHAQGLSEVEAADPSVGPCGPLWKVGEASPPPCGNLLRRRRPPGESEGESSAPRPYWLRSGRSHGGWWRPSGCREASGLAFR